MPETRSDIQGFTLIELLVVLALLGIVSMLAYPNFKDTVELVGVQTQTNKFMNSLLRARSEAVRYNKTAIMCNSSNGTTCGNKNALTWDRGWIIFIDENLDQQFNGSDKLVSVEPGTQIPDNIIINSGNSFRNAISFNSDGTVTPFSTSTPDNLIAFCPKQNKIVDGYVHNGRQIVIDKSGRPRISKEIQTCIP